jgi:putative transcriptional regulator
VEWYGLGKKRTKLGKFLDEHRITQQELVERSGVSRATIHRLCNDDTYRPNMKTATKIVNALRRFDDKLTMEDFWG